MGFFALLALHVLPVARYNMLRDVFRWSNCAFLGSIPVLAINVFELWSGSDVSHYKVDCVISFIRSCAIGNLIFVRHRCGNILDGVHWWLRAGLTLVCQSSRCRHGWSVGHTTGGYCIGYTGFDYDDDMRLDAYYPKRSNLTA